MQLPASRWGCRELSTVQATPLLLTQPMKLRTGAFQFAFRNTSGLNSTVLSAKNPAVHVENLTSRGIASEVSPGLYQFTDAIPDGQQRFYVVRSP
jgi:hypothetical protein